MTKVQYAKLLIQQANKRMADQLREEKVHGNEFRKLQGEKFQEQQAKVVEATSQQKLQATAAVDGQKAKNTGVVQEVRQTIEKLQLVASEQKMLELARARELAEHAKKVQSPRILEVKSARESSLSRGAQATRAEMETYHQIVQSFETAEEKRKREMRDRMRVEIGPEALMASARVVTGERREAVQEVKVMKVKGEEKMKTDREKQLAGTKANMKAITEFKAGAKNSRSNLSTRRQTDAEEMRRKKTSDREKKKSNEDGWSTSKRKSRDAVLEARRPEGNPPIAALTVGASQSPMTPSGTPLRGTPLKSPGKGETPLK